MSLPFLAGRSTRGGMFAAGPAGAVPPVTRESDLIGWWKFDEESGTSAADSSDTDNAAALTNATFDSSGKNGFCVLSDGTGDRVRIPKNAAYGVTPFSITAWINAEAHVANACIIQSFDEAYPLAGTMFMRTSSSTVVQVVRYLQTTGFEIDAYTVGTYAGGWHHMAFTVVAVGDGTFTTKFYWDASLKTSSYTGSGSAGIWADALDTGSGWQIIQDRGTAGVINGRMDDLRIYGVELSADNVSDIYNGGDGDWG